MYYVHVSPSIQFAIIFQHHVCFTSFFHTFFLYTFGLVFASFVLVHYVIFVSQSYEMKRELFCQMRGNLENERISPLFFPFPPPDSLNFQEFRCFIYFFLSKRICQRQRLSDRQREREENITKLKYGKKKSFDIVFFKKSSCLHQ